MSIPWVGPGGGSGEAFGLGFGLACGGGLGLGLGGAAVVRVGETLGVTAVGETALLGRGAGDALAAAELAGDGDAPVEAASDGNGSAGAAAGVLEPPQAARRTVTAAPAGSRRRQDMSAGCPGWPVC